MSDNEDDSTPEKENIYADIKKALDEMKNNQSVVRANQFLEEHQIDDDDDFELDSVAMHKLSVANYTKELNKFTL